MEKIRTIITQDAEVDDQNSLRHFMLYANEVDLQGIVQTSSKFHWIGIPGAVKPDKPKLEKVVEFETDNGPYDQPYRWTGTDWMQDVINDYEKDYPNLVKHADGYPTPEYLRSITKIGNIGYEGEIEKPSEGSELIKERILDDDPRTLYIQVWGGCNTIARALMDIQAEYEGKPGWDELHRKISGKVILTACGEQDPSYGEYIAEEWPDIMFVKTLQMESYAYPWFLMPESDSKDTLKADFMKTEILNGKSALTDGYCTWLDGHRYVGEAESEQFGTNEALTHEGLIAFIGCAPPNKYDFLSEGDSPTFFMLFDWGLRTLEDFRYGGFSGRYEKIEKKNSKGEPVNYWDVCKDSFTGRDGETKDIESMWPYVADIQRDFAARVAWAAAPSYEEGEHRPSLCIKEGADISAAAGETVVIHAETSSPDKAAVNVTFRIYPEASAPCAADAELKSGETTAACGRTLETAGRSAELTVPNTAKTGDKIHVIVKAEADSHHKPSHYQQVIITIK